MTNEQQIFFDKVKEFDDNFISIEKLRNVIVDEMNEKGFKTLKEILISSTEYAIYSSKIDLNKIYSLLNQNSTKINPFNVFYLLDEEVIHKVMNIIVKTHKAIDYYNKYASKHRELKEENKISKKSSPKVNQILGTIDMIFKIDIDVKDYLEKLRKEEKVEYQFIPQGWKVIEYLFNLEGSLHNSHFTKIQLYQNLLYELYFILKDEHYTDIKTNKHKIFSKNLIFDIVDKLIKYYFCENDTQIIEKHKIFSTSINFDTYIEKKYIYETNAGITLTHSTKGMQF